MIARALGAMFLSLLCACDEPAPPVTTPSAEPAPDVEGFCRNACQRAGRCGLEAVQARASDGRPSDREALAQAAREAPATEQRCVEDCRHDTPTQIRDVALFRKTEACLAAQSCDGLLACLDASARLRPPH